MKNLTILLTTLLVLAACKDKKDEPQPMNPVHEMHVKSAELYGRAAYDRKSTNFIAEYLAPKTMDISVERVMTSEDYKFDSLSTPYPWLNADELINQWFQLDQILIYPHFIQSPNQGDYANFAINNYTSNNVKGSGTIFKELAAQFKDYGYNGGYWVRAILFSPLKQLSIVSDVDFDEQHPAGMPLDDLINVQYYSAEKFIKSGYSDFDAGNVYNKLTESLVKLNSMNINLYNGLCLRFTKLPTNKGLYTFTMTYRNADDLKLTAEVTIKLLGEQ